MRKPLIDRHRMPAVVILLVLLVLTILDSAGVLASSVWVMRFGFGLYAAACLYDAWHRLPASWRVKDDRRPSWAEDED